MKTFEATCRIVTPLFMGGASQQPELRTQSINGVLRWWFRVAGGSLEDEKRIFGWAGETSNQGLVRIFIKEPTFQPQPFPSGQPGSDYLGFSLKLTRRLAVPENETFHLKISFHPKATDDDIKKFFSALWLAFNLGNFGSRARRGFGAIRIEEIREKGASITNNCYGLNFVPSGDLKNWINNSLDKIRDFIKPNERQEIPYLFKDFEIYQIQKDNFNHWKNWIKEVQEGRQGSYLKNSWSGKSINNWLELLGFMGFLLMAYRSYRKPDYDVAKNILLGGQVSDPTFERAIFGLPLNFYFSSINKRDMVHLKLGNETLRRASPLMIKIIQIGTKQDEISYEGLFIIMKSTFMPANARLVFSNKEVNLPNNIWQALDDFISTLQNNNLIRR
ncbi:MAG: type III-B CRISPR module RAMP protein Cmr1, partial [Thermodesulfobacteriaceae bacterium]